MKRLFITVLICILLSGCATTQARKGQSAEEAVREVEFLQLRNGQRLSVGASEKYPKIVVTHNGHALLMQPTGNIMIVVNPDGSHSTAVINGKTATIITP